MIELNKEQLKALDESIDIPPRVIDPTTAANCVLLKSADFEWIRGLLNDQPDAPRLVDPRTQHEYALIRYERYERFKAFFEEDPITPEEKKGLLRTIGEKVGWDDPAFDVYDASDSRGPK